MGRHAVLASLLLGGLAPSSGFAAAAARGDVDIDDTGVHLDSRRGSVYRQRQGDHLPGAAG
jgi:hypothetical protein